MMGAFCFKMEIEDNFNITLLTRITAHKQWGLIINIAFNFLEMMQMSRQPEENVCHSCLIALCH